MAGGFPLWKHPCHLFLYPQGALPHRCKERCELGNARRLFPTCFEFSTTAIRRSFTI